MDKLKAMSTFVAIVDQGSLSAAGDKLDRSPAAIVRTLAGLERHLGVRLLNRSTRRLALTDEGRDYLQHCRQILADIHGAEARLDSRRTEPAGTLSITAPVMFGHLHLTPLLNQWLKQHPQMRADLTLLDRVNAERDVFLTGATAAGRFYGRVCVLCFRTRRAHVAQAIDALHRLAR